MSGARDVGGGLVLTRREQIVSLVLTVLVTTVLAVLICLDARDAYERRLLEAPERGGR